MDRLSYNDMGLRDLAAIPAAAHQENVARDVLRAAWRRRRMVAAIACAVAALTTAVLATRPPRYPSEAIIELHVGRPDAIAGEASAAVVVEAASIVLGEARIIRSRMIALRVVERLGLASDPEFTGRGRLARALESLRAAIGLPAAPTDGVAEAERALLRGLSVETDNRSYLISITFTASQPDTAVRIANAVAEEYLARRLEGNLDAAGRSAAWLNTQVAAAETQLRAAEAAVAAFRGRTGLVHLGGPGETLRQQEIRTIATQLQAAVVERTNEEARLARLEARLRESGAVALAAELQATPAVQLASQQAATARRELADLQSRLGPRHPAVQQGQATRAAAEAALAEAIETAVGDLRAQLGTTRSGEQALRSRLAGLERGLVDEAADETTLAGLTATANAMRERVLTLTRSRDQARGLRELRSVPASLIVPAQTPRQPAGPNAIMLVLLSLGGGLVAGITVAALLERRDRGFRTTDEVAGATGLRCLSLIPERGADDPPLTLPRWLPRTSAQVMFDESVRMVASSVGLFASGRREGGQIVLVTSSLAEEGRSTLCAGLARSLTLAGRRVLLIDGPPRRFDAAAEPVIDPAATPPAAVPTDATLVVLHRNAASAFSLDVFGSPRLAEGLEQARKHFDVIIVEGPPVLLVADALVLGRMADTVLHAVRWADTRRRTVQTALRRMQDHGVMVDGIVLTRVEVARHGELGLADPASHHLSSHDYYGRNITTATRPLALGQ